MKNIQQPPIGIIVSFGVEMMEKNGGRETFLKSFEHWMGDDSENCWLHKSRNRPQFEIAQVYIAEGGQIYGRAFYGGYETGPRKIIRTTGEIGKIEWPRILLAGPFEKRPQNLALPYRGFQGFRYIYNPLW